MKKERWIDRILCCFRKKNQKSVSHENVISVEAARDLVLAWREHYPEQPKGFTVPLSDIEQLLEEDGVAEARVYLASDFAEASGEKFSNQVKIVLVGVDSAGNDMIDSEKEQYIYDFTKPCPPKCGSGGLNKW